MTAEELVQELLNRKELLPPPPHPLENPMDAVKEGMGAVLLYLECADGPVTAGAISTAAGVSTARIAVLLKKLDEKGLITRTVDKKDARKTLVSLSEAGMEYTAKQRAEITDLLTDVFNQVGPDRVRLMMDIQEEVHSAMLQYMSRHAGPKI